MIFPTSMISIENTLRYHMITYNFTSRECGIANVSGLWQIDRGEVGAPLECGIANVSGLWESDGGEARVLHRCFFDDFVTIFLKLFAIYILIRFNFNYHSRECSVSNVSDLWEDDGSELRTPLECGIANGS